MKLTLRTMYKPRSRSSTVTLLSCLVLLFALITPARAQEYRARVQGFVTDPSKAGVAGADVVLKNQGTGIATTRKSNEQGMYLFDMVQPGTYTVSVSAPGFQTFQAADLLVQTRADLTVNAPLTLGTVSNSVNVSAQSTTVEFNSASISGTINGKLLEQMPVISRNPFALVVMEPAVTNRYGMATMDTSQNLPYEQISHNGMNIAGPTGGQNQLLLDGVDTRIEQRGSYAPSMDAVQEVVVQQNPVDAEYGNSGGAAVSVSLKSGTNDLKGSAYYYGRNPMFDAVPSAITRTPSNARNHIFGTALGGPVVFPKVYNGKNKAFWFFSYERWQATQSGGVETATLPTSLERTGDFSKSMNMYGTLRTIYDPMTTVTDASTNTARRVPFAGNVIPANRIDPSAAALMKYIWQPNGSGDNPLTGANNWKASTSIAEPYTNISARGDYNFSENWRAFGRYSYQRLSKTPNSPVDSAAYMNWGAGRTSGLNVAGNLDGSLNSTTLVNFRFGYTRSNDALEMDSAKSSVAAWKSIWPNSNWWQQSLSANSDVYFPSFSAGGRSFGNPSGWDLQPRQTSLSGMLIKQAGSHYLKAGVKITHYSSDSGLPDWGNFNFDAGLTSSTYMSSPTDVSGDSWATFLLGYPGSGYTNYASRVWTTSNNAGVFFQDDWKVSRNLTVNLGLRWEYDQAPAEAHNRLVRNLDLTSPIPEFQTNAPVFPDLSKYGSFPRRFNGALQFLDSSNPRLFHAQKDIFLPRIGLAYRLNDLTSIRFGFARYAIPFQTSLGPNWNLPNTGFSQRTNILAPIAGVPQTQLSDPFPAQNPVLAPVGSSLGRYSQLGSSVVFYNQYPRQPITDRLDVSLQRELPGHVRLDLTGFISIGRNVPVNDVYGGDVSYELDNMMNPQLNYTYKSELAQAVSNPFYQYLTPQRFPGSLRYQKTVSLGSLLTPYPQYGSIKEMYTGGVDNRYRSFQLKAQKAFARGLTFSLGYNYSRSLADQYLGVDLNRYNRLYTMYDTGAFRHKLTVAPFWELPFGKGRAFAQNLNPVLEAILGGWTTSHLFQFNSGNLVPFGAAQVNGDPRIGNPSRDRWFDTQAFGPLPAYTIRTNPVYYDRVAGPLSWNLDSTLAKNFQVTERARLELRMDAFNAANHFLSTMPVTDVRSPLFGRSTGQLNIGREMQYTLRLHF